MSEIKSPNPVAETPKPEAVKAKAITAAPAKPMTVSVKQCVYLGPSRPFGLPLMSNAILRCEPEQLFPSLKELFAEHKGFKRLFVQIADLAQARRRMGIPGSDMATAFAAIQKASADARKK